jgi:hypothetical protein
MTLYRVDNREELIGKTLADVSAAMQYDGTPSHEAAMRHIEIAVKNGLHIFPWRHRGPSPLSLDQADAPLDD